MTVDQLLWAILAGVIGSLVVAVISWFFGLRKVNSRVDGLNNEVADLKHDMAYCLDLLDLLVDTVDDRQIGKALKRSLRRDRLSER